ncbi:hypothetical protein ACH5RR_040763 [Cinchona calisaya]|uniref:Glycoside hydrolase family 19 catalytic domain-containing protein n=1 Tax=Cinchona calisaya TaxID=153742 RepID=A0ABD2XTN9_9GENT
MRSILSIVVIVSALLVPISFADESSAPAKVVKVVKGKKYCTKGWECEGPSQFCCNLTISDYFQTYQFENLFSKRNSPMKEISAFLGHVGSKTSCGYGVATGGPLAWGLCYNKEMSPSQIYCDDYYKLTYPCAPGVGYHGRGALPIYWNYNYGAIGEALKEDLLNHPEYIEQNATLAFQAAIYNWMTPVKKGQPSAHDAFVGSWKPTKNDTLEKRVPGFGVTMNILYGDSVCGQGDVDSMNNIISHYLYYLDLSGVGREEAGPHEILSCTEQKAFNPSYSPSSSS